MLDLIESFELISIKIMIIFLKKPTDTIIQNRYYRVNYFYLTRLNLRRPVSSKISVFKNVISSQNWKLIMMDNKEILKWILCIVAAGCLCTKNNIVPACLHQKYIMKCVAKSCNYPKICHIFYLKHEMQTKILSFTWN